MEKQQTDLDSILGYKGLRAQQVEPNKANNQWDSKDKKEGIKSAGQIDEKDDDDPDDLDDDLDDDEWECLESKCKCIREKVCPCLKQA